MDSAGSAGAGVGSDSAAEAVKSAPHFGHVVGHSGVEGDAFGLFAFNDFDISFGRGVAILLVPREKFLRGGYSRFFRR